MSLSPSLRRSRRLGATFVLLLLTLATPLPASAVQVAPAELVAVAVDRGAEPDPEILDELETGRYWHASRLLARSGDEGGRWPLLRARADAGWGNWPEAWSTLEGVEGSPAADAAPAWELRGRAAEELGRSEEALRSYRRALELDDGAEPYRAEVIRSRMTRLLARDGDLDAALHLLAEVSDRSPGLGSWLAVEVAEITAEAGAVDATEEALQHVRVEAAKREAAELPVRARLAAGDTAAAVGALAARAGNAGAAEERSVAWARVGRLHLARGDTIAARAAFRNGFAEAETSPAAAGVLETAAVDAGEALDLHRILLEASDHEAALEALERHLELRDGSEPLAPELRMERARLLVRTDGPLEEAVSELRELAGSESAELAAPALDLWRQVRRRQGRGSDVRVLEERLLDRFPSRPEALDVRFFRADASHDRGAWSDALEGYRAVVDAAPAAARAGLARMRIGQIHLTRGRPDDAARLFEDYLEAFPRGRRWQEAAYWAAWSRQALGEQERARTHVERIRRDDPLSYYAVLGARLLDEPFAPDVAPGTRPPESGWIDEELQQVEALRRAGLAAGISDRIEKLAERARPSEDVLLRLSLELSERGFAHEGLSLAWEVRRSGRDWDRWLLRAVYPFPYRELVRREAEEWGLEPFYLAAVIRQESAFLADARSSAGALGLMQVIPSTGRSVASSVGPDPFSESALLHPEVNLHLGGAFLAGLHDRFGDRVPFVLAAYNAGPTRTRRWERGFPEAEDPWRFVERIPYPETRGYVKQVTRNLEMYRFLYGSDGG